MAVAFGATMRAPVGGAGAALRARVGGGRGPARRGSGVRTGAKGQGGKGFGASPSSASSPSSSGRRRAGREAEGGEVDGGAARRAREAEEAEDALRYTESDPEWAAARAASVPTQVTDRMLGRMLGFSALPLLAAVGVLPLFYYLKVVQHVELPNWLGITVSSTCWVVSGLGLSYGALSSSWDLDRTGTFFGTDEVKKNLPIVVQWFKDKGARGR